MQKRKKKGKKWAGIFVLWLCLSVALNWCDWVAEGLVLLNACEMPGARHDCDYAGTNMLFKMSYYELMLPY